MALNLFPFIHIASREDSVSDEFIYLRNVWTPTSCIRLKNSDRQCSALASEGILSLKQDPNGPKHNAFYLSSFPDWYFISFSFWIFIILSLFFLWIHITLSQVLSDLFWFVLFYIKMWGWTPNFISITLVTALKKKNGKHTFIGGFIVKC